MKVRWSTMPKLAAKIAIHLTSSTSFVLFCTLAQVDCSDKEGFETVAGEVSQSSGSTDL